jgi:hypothetical protein
MATSSFDSRAAHLADLGRLGRDSLSDDQITGVIKMLPKFFRELLVVNGIEERAAKALTTKFRDAGRRSAPWKAFSSKVAGRPQDGEDGNRINRWMLPTDHKQYATEREATLVEISFYMQALSFTNAPKIAEPSFENAWSWILGHPVRQGKYLDPIQLRPISLTKVLESPRMITSGHINPLDRGGKHEIGNVFLVLHRSNQMQGNMTLSEFLLASNEIVEKHREHGTFPELEGQDLMKLGDFLDSPHG